ncbi:MAG: hypothetical protein ABI778_10485, partial [Ignavibacteriota bacterium]
MIVDKIIRRKRDEPLSEADYSAAKKELLSELQALTEFADVDEFTPEERIARALTDDIYFARTYLPHYFKSDTQAEFHDEIFSAMDLREKPIVLTAFRGAAKSTIVMTKILKWMLYRQRRFIVEVLDTEDKAEMYTLAILTELQSNRRILQDFGLRVSKDAARGNFLSFDPETKERHCRLMAWGLQMSMRGLRDGDMRPDAVIVEDAQDSEGAMSEGRTKKAIRTIVQDYRYALAASDWFLMVIGNVIRSNSLIDQFLKKAKSWIRLIYPAERKDASGNRVATWPGPFPLEKLDQMRNDSEVGGEAVYRAEMLCEAVEMDGLFKESWFRHHDNSIYPGFNTKAMYMQCDPSFSDTGDNKAFVIGAPYALKKEDEHYGTVCDATGKPLTEGLYYVLLDIFNRKCSIDESIEVMYKWNDRWHP